MTREVLRWAFNPATPNTAPPEMLDYADLADAAYSALTGVPNDVLMHRDWRDRHGNWITGYFGPTGLEWNGVGVEEPPELLAARSTATLTATVEWPDEE